MSVRFVKAPIKIEFDLQESDMELFTREYHQLSESDDDPIAQWLKRAKGRGETSDSDPVLLNLIVELHRKIDNLERIIKDEEPQRLSLSSEAMIDSIGYGYFKLKQEVLEEGNQYYGRIEMPVHPKHDIPIFFIAKSSTVAKISKIHERDEKEWASYLTARERVMIREMREAK
ncbi:MAG: hypothetical protein U9P71_07025 [Campylobacterota bacterium]|nr:hypothetical protein [Campylobacterota bacterium]